MLVKQWWVVKDSGAGEVCVHVYCVLCCRTYDASAPQQGGDNGKEERNDEHARAGWSALDGVLHSKLCWRLWVLVAIVQHGSQAKCPEQDVSKDQVAGGALLSVNGHPKPGTHKPNHQSPKEGKQWRGSETEQQGV